MSNLSVMSSDNYMICPYDSTHRILSARMPLHLTKCHSQHMLDPLQACPFNTKHMVPKEDMCFHLLRCEAKVIIESDIISHDKKQSLQDESAECQQAPDQGPERNVSDRCPGRKRIPSKLMTDKMLSKIETLSETDKELMWDEDVRQSGVVIRPFIYGESSFSLENRYSLKTHMVPLRKPLDVVQISESRHAHYPFMYNYALNSAGIGRGAGRGKPASTKESCSNVNHSGPHIGSLGRGRARSKIAQ